MVSTANTSDGAIAEPVLDLVVGGGFYAIGGVTFINCTASNNIVIGKNGSSNPEVNEAGQDVSGGGFYAVGSTANPRLVNVRATGNSITGGNGGAGAINNNGLRGMSGGSARGGGIYLGHLIQVYNAVMSGNTARGGNGGSPGGGAKPAEGGLAGTASGGGMYFEFNTNLYSATLNANSAIGGNGGNGFLGAQNAVGGDAEGGGLSFRGGGVVNSTISGNTVTGGTGRIPGKCFGGGAIVASLTNDGFRNSTITANNNPLCTGGGVYNSDIENRHAALGNTIVAGNNAAAGKDLYGMFFSAGANIVGIGDDGGGRPG